MVIPYFLIYIIRNNFGLNIRNSLKLVKIFYLLAYSIVPIIVYDVKQGVVNTSRKGQPHAKNSRS